MVSKCEIVHCKRASMLHSLGNGTSPQKIIRFKSWPSHKWGSSSITMSTQSSVLNKLALCNQGDAQAEHREEREDGPKDL